jgi:hypothetical protein
MVKAAGLLLAALLLHLVLVQPNHPGAATWGALRLVPLELPAILLAMLALRGRPGLLLRGALAASLALMVVLKAADMAMFVAFNRAFLPLIDWHLAPAGLRLVAGSTGAPAAAGLAVAAVLAAGLVAGSIWWATGRWAGFRPAAGWRALSGLGAVLATGLAIADAGHVARAWTLPGNPPGSAFTLRLAGEKLASHRQALADLAAFRAEAAADPLAAAAPLFDRLAGRDVTIVFVESYGRASFDNPAYAPTHTASLRRAEPAIAAAGLAMRSGWLTSPIEGGQSWLAHGTLAAGLTVSDQTRYGAMLASGRRTLFHLAAASGYDTAAVMPAITLAWPEGPMLGFGRILGAADMGYRGPAFNWVTMPDQYTLTAWQRLLGPADRPRMTQVALVSSHAPWVPVPAMVDPGSIGDGSGIFDAMAQAGDPPSVVWRDEARIREAYRRTLDYSLQAVLAHAARPDTVPPLLVVLGDHQAAGFVAGAGGRDVPVHLIGPPDAVALFDGWGWTEGLVPDAALPAWPMAEFRDRFVAATSTARLPGGV